MTQEHKVQISAHCCLYPSPYLEYAYIYIYIYILFTKAYNGKYCRQLYVYAEHTNIF